MIWMGNDLSLINDWETYLKGIHLQYGMGSLLRWTGALERTHVLPAGLSCADASLRERVWDVAEVPESIPLSPLLPLGNEMCSDVDSSPPLVSLCCSLSLHFSPSHLFIRRCWVFSPLPRWVCCEMLDCSLHLFWFCECVTKEHMAFSKINVCPCHMYLCVCVYWCALSDGFVNGMTTVHP